MIMEIRPTVYFVMDNGELFQKARMKIKNEGPDLPGRVLVTAGTKEYITNITCVKNNEGEYDILVPDITNDMPITFTLLLDNGEKAEYETNWKPGKHWEIHILPITHHDLGYTNAIEPLLEDYLHFYDDILEFCKKTDSMGEDEKYRYTIEESWSLLHYLQNRPKEVIDEFMKYVNAGRIEVSAFFANITDVVCSHEEIIRLMYPTFELKRKYGIPVTCASITDIPGLSWSIPSLLASVGVKYFFAGLPWCYFETKRKREDSNNPSHSFWDEKKILREHGRPDAFIWEGIDGAQVYLQYDGDYGFNMRSFNKQQSYSELKKEIEISLDELENNGCPFSILRHIDYGWDNHPPQSDISHFVKKWNSEVAYPRLKVSTNSRYFGAVQKEYKNLRTFRGEIPHTDYTAASTSEAYETGLNRITHERIQTAERFTGIYNSFAGAKFTAERTEKIYCDIMLFDEHCYGMCIPFGKFMDWNWNTKKQYAIRAAAKAEELLYEAVADISAAIERKVDGTYIIVNNSMSFNRSDLVRVTNFELFDKNFRVVDVETGKEVIWQLNRIDDPYLPMPYASHRFAAGYEFEKCLYELVFVAEDVPQMGYRTYKIEIVETRPQFIEEVKVEGTVLENRYFKVEFNSINGTITSIYDKEAKKELVDSSAPHSLNQLIVKQVDKKIEYSPETAEISTGVKGPVYCSVLIKSACKGCPIVVQEVIIYDRIKRIDIANRILKDSTPLQELYFSFPFDIDRPKFSFEGTMIPEMKPFEDQLPGTNTNYYSIQHWAKVCNEDTSLVFSPIEAGIVEFGGLWTCSVSQIHHGIAPEGYGKGFIKKEDIKKGHIYSFIMNSNYQTNFSSVQLSDSLFRYSIGVVNPTKDGGTEVQRFGWSIANQLTPFVISGVNEGSLGSSDSFLKISQDNIMLYAFKPAEDGIGLIIRLAETAGKDTAAVVEIPHFKISRATKTNLVEENEEVIESELHKLEIQIKAYSVATVRLETGTIDLSRYNYFVNFSDKKLFY